MSDVKMVTYTVKVTQEQFELLKKIEKQLGVRREILLPALAQVVVKNYKNVLPILSTEISDVTMQNIALIAGNGGFTDETDEPKETPKPTPKPATTPKTTDTK